MFSETCGVATAIAGGNVLITSSDAGRALEVMPDGEVVWEYFNPARAGSELQFIAAIFEMTPPPEECRTRLADSRSITWRIRAP